MKKKLQFILFLAIVFSSNLAWAEEGIVEASGSGETSTITETVATTVEDVPDGGFNHVGSYLLITMLQIFIFKI